MSLQALPALNEALVYAGEQRVGLLRRTALDVQFIYDQGVRGLPIATTLPLRAEPYSSGRPGAVPPFFAGLLPEGRRLTALRRAIKTSADDDLNMLLAIGSDTIGQVRILAQPEPPPGEIQARVDGNEPRDMGVEDVNAFEEVVFAELFARVLSRDPADRVGLPGVQDKVSGAMISLPLSHRNASWILKFNPPEFRFLVENEAFFLSAAEASGLPVPARELVHDARGEVGLLIKRFDRMGEKRLAQEDGCQVCGRYPADKYRIDTETLFSKLASVCSAPIVAARDLMRQLLFAYLSCNGEAHAKNFSILRDDLGEWAVSPAYDLPSTHPYGDTSMALPVGGKRREDLCREDFLKLGAHLGLRPRPVVRVIDQMLQALPEWIDGLSALPFDQRTNNKLRRAIEYRAERLRSRP